MGHRVVIYTKEECCLCDKAKALLQRLQGEFDLEVKEVDITRDPAIFEQYRYNIPVAVVDGLHRFEATKIAEHYLRRVLRGR